MLTVQKLHKPEGARQRFPADLYRRRFSRRHRGPPGRPDPGADRLAAGFRPAAERTETGGGRYPGQQARAEKRRRLRLFAERCSAAIAAACPGVRVAEAYIGPVFCTKAGVADLVHPEHGNHHYRGEMSIAVVYQRNLDVEEREERCRIRKKQGAEGGECGTKARRPVAALRLEEEAK